MIKKVVLVGVIVLLILPVQTGSGTHQPVDARTRLKGAGESSCLDIGTMLNAVNESSLTSYVEKFVSFGAKRTGSRNCRNTADWLQQEFKTLGLYTYFEGWKFPKYKYKNVIAVQNGTGPQSDAIIVICAHYDTFGRSPGAVDDGSGIAAMLTIASITSKYTFNHTIRFVAVSGEEEGTYGSFADAKQAYRDHENILTVINLDMIGYTNSSQDGSYMHTSGPERSQWLVDLSVDLAHQFNDYIHLEIVPLLNYPCDHDSYNDYGYDGVWFSQFNPDQYKAMHTPKDTIDNVNFTYLSKVTKLALAVTATLAMKPLDVQVRITAPYEGSFYLKNMRLIKLPCYNFWRLKVRAVTYILGKTTVQINITSDETISYVYYAVDGCIKHVTNTPPYDYTIGNGNLDFYFKLHKGYHRVTVSVVTTQGTIASDEMDIFVLKLW